MKREISIALGISFLLSILLCCLFVFTQYLHKQEVELSVDLIPFFSICFVILTACIQWLLRRERVQLDELTKREFERMRELEVYRREFLAEVSHELRTPIFAVQGFIHTLLEGAVDDLEIRDKFLKKAAKNADRLSNLVNDLLIITQIEAGEIEMKMRHFDLIELIQDVVESLEHKMTKKGRGIRYKLETSPREIVFADRERIQQVISNFIDNAIKYGNPQGCIRIITESDRQKVKISISDDGPGIPFEHLDKIFKRFYRVDKSRSREKGGTGLGLAICKYFVEAHGENISVQSSSAGTTFSFSLKKQGDLEPEDGDN